MASKHHPGPATVEGVEEGEEGGSEAESEGGEEEGEDKRLSPDECAKRRKWEREQEELKERLEVEDGEEVASWEGDTLPFARLTTIAGVDISFDKAHPDHACAMLTVLTYPQLKVVHESRAVVEMREPYIPGFLAFREVDFLLERLREVQRQHPQHYPQVILVDGNGILHPRGFGLASHLGVLADIPSVGVGKKLYHVDGLEKGPDHKQRIQTQLRKRGDYFHLIGDSGMIWGAAVRTSAEATNPVYVSVGHKISLDTAVGLVLACSLKRVPEPVRQADLLSRKYLRKEKRTHK